MLSRPPDRLELDERPVVAIYRSPLFLPSETFIQTHATSLVRYQPVLVGTDDCGNVRPALRERIVLPSSTWRQIEFRLLGRAQSIARRLRATSPSLIHAHFATDGVMALPLARALGIPLVTTLHGFDVTRTRGTMLASGRLSWVKYALLQRRLVEAGALFLAVSDALRAKAIARGFPPERTLTHYLGIDLGRFLNRGVDPEPGLVLHVGRLVEKKGTAFLLDAFARVRTRVPTARLVIIGEGPERSKLELRCASLALGDAVTFLGAQDQQEVADWMRRAWVLAVPSLTARDGDAEGGPLVVVEAAAASTPSVGFRHGGIPEMVTDGQTGFVVDERDREGLAERLILLLTSPDLRRRMGHAARTLAEERFDCVRQTARLEGYYDALRRDEPA